MEARRAFQTGAGSSKQMWIVVAALLVVLALGVAGAYLAKGFNRTNVLNHTNASSGAQVVQTGVQGRDPYSPRDSMGAPISTADPYSPRDPLGAGK